MSLLLRSLIGLSIVLTSVTSAAAQTTVQDFSILKSKADSLFDSQNYSEALANYKNLIDQFNKTNLEKTEEYYSTELRIAECLLSSQLYDDAEEQLKRLNNNIDQLKSPSLKSELYFLKGKFLTDKKREYQAAYDSFQKAYNTQKGLKEPSIKLRSRYSYDMAMSLIQYLNKPDSAVFYAELTIDDYTQVYGEMNNQSAFLYRLIATGYFLRDNEKYLYNNVKSVITFCMTADSSFLDDAVNSDQITSNEFIKWLVIKIPSVIDKLSASSAGSLANIANSMIAYKSDLILAEAFIKLSEKINQRYSQIRGIAGDNEILGSILYRRNQFNRALDYYSQAEKYLRKMGMNNPNVKDNITWVYLNKSALFQTLSDQRPDSKVAIRYRDSARFYANEGLELRRSLQKEPHPAFSYFYYALAVHSISEENFGQAIEFLDRAEANQFPVTSGLYFNRGISHLNSGENKVANEHFEKALSSFSSKDDINYTSYLNIIGNALLEIDNLEIALNYFDKSILANQQIYDTTVVQSLSDIELQEVLYPIIFTTTVDFKARVLLRKYYKYKNQKDLNSAIEYFEFGKKVINHVRISLLQDADNIQFNTVSRSLVEGALNAYHLMDSLETGGSYLKKALEIAEIGHSQIVLDAIKARQQEASSSNSDIAQISDLKRKIKNQRSLLKNQSINKQTNESSVDQNEVLLNMEDKLSQRLDEIKIGNPSIYRLLSNENENLSFDFIENYLIEQDAILIEYFWDKNDLFIIQIQKDEMTMRKVNTGLAELKQKALAYKEQTRSSKPLSEPELERFIEDSYFLYRHLLGDINYNSEKTRLIIIPDGVLSDLPFETLISKPDQSIESGFNNLPFLIKTRQVDYASSSRILTENLQSGNQNTSLDFAAWAPFSDTLETKSEIREILRNEDLGALPGSVQELEVLSSVYNGKQYSGKKASERSFKEYAEDAKIIHIATHGLINDRQAVLSNLLFEQNSLDSTEDNKLYIFELYAMQLNAELAVLTACNTGAGRQELGEGTMSLARAFKYAGAKSVLMSLWLANDQSTSDIIGDFYQNLANGQGKGEALRNAKLVYLETADNITTHPFYWSHLVLSGDNSPITPGKDNKRLIMFILMGVVVLVIISRIIRKRHSA